MRCNKLEFPFRLYIDGEFYGSNEEGASGIFTRDNDNAT